LKSHNNKNPPKARLNRIRTHLRTFSNPQLQKKSVNRQFFGKKGRKFKKTPYLCTVKRPSLVELVNFIPVWIRGQEQLRE